MLLLDGVELYVHSVQDVLDDNDKKVHTLIVLGSKKLPGEERMKVNEKNKAFIEAFNKEFEKQKF